jgi:hypothetical protein
MDDANVELLGRPTDRWKGTKPSFFRVRPDGQDVANTMVAILAVIVCVLNLLLGAPGVIMAPTAALKVAIAVTEVEFALIIVLVVVLPSSRRAFVASS